MRVYSASPESSRIYIYNQTFVSLRHRSRCRMAHSGDLCHHRLAAMTPYLPVSKPWFSTRCCPPELIPGILVWRQIKNQTYSCSVAPKETQFCMFFAISQWVLLNLTFIQCMEWPRVTLSRERGLAHVFHTDPTVERRQSEVATTKRSPQCPSKTDCELGS